jgi:Saxitoxin biosynthesis operon protein SxtJ
MAGALTAVSLILAWEGRAAYRYGLLVALILALLAVAAPRLLAPVEVAWMAVSARVGRVGNTVILTVFFYVMLAPLALALRLAGRDRLGLRPAARDSYWESLPQDETQDYSKPF